MDPRIRIRIHTKMSWIRALISGYNEYGSGSGPKSGSGYCPNPDQGLDTKNITFEKKIPLYQTIKIYIYPYASMKKVQATWEASSHQKRTASTTKHFIPSLHFGGKFCPPGFRPGSSRPNSMQIHGSRSIRLQSANPPAHSREGLGAEEKFRTYTEVINIKHKSTCW